MLQVALKLHASSLGFKMGCMEMNSMRNGERAGERKLKRIVKI